MSKKSLALLLVIIMLSVGLLAVGCEPEEEGAEEPVDGEEAGDEETGDDEAGDDEESALVMAIWSAPEGNFNPNLYESAYDAYAAVDPCFTGMMTHDPDADYELIPELAESMEVSDDEMTFTYTLKDDIYFHDGEPVTTEDVKWTFEWMMDEDYTGVRASYWETIEEIEIEDERTIHFHFEEVDAPALINVSTWAISPKHVFEDTPIAELEEHPNVNQEPIGAGPYKLTEYADGQYTILEAFDDYVGGKPNVDQITVKTASSDTQMAELITGSSDLAWVQPEKDEFEAYQEEGLEVVNYPANAYQYMGIKLDHPVLSDKNVRHALTHAIDRWEIIDALFEGMASVQTSHMSMVSWAYDEDLEPLPYDVERANELLEESGWEMDDDDGYRYKDGERLEFTLSYPSGNAPRERNAEIIQDMASDAGIAIELDMMEFTTLTDLIFEERDFELYLMGWSLALEPDPTGIWLSDDQWNAVGFDHPDNDELIREARRTTDMEERAEIYSEWQELLVEEAPYVWLYAEDEAFVHTPDLKNFQGDAFSMWWNVEEWELDR
ncbi:MAG: ABC transporter substrate-binding protein [Bacillota bacterium]